MLHFRGRNLGHIHKEFLALYWRTSQKVEFFSTGLFGRFINGRFSFFYWQERFFEYKKILYHHLLKQAITCLQSNIKKLWAYYPANTFVYRLRQQNVDSFPQTFSNKSEVEALVVCVWGNWHDVINPHNLHWCSCCIFRMDFVVGYLTQTSYMSENLLG